MKKTTLIWFRRNLRLRDNAVLQHAVSRGLPLAAVYVLERPSEIANPRAAAFRYQAAAELARGLAKRGVPLIALQGGADEWVEWAQRLNAQTVLADEGYTSSEILEDNRIWRVLDENGIPFERVNDRAVFAKADLMSEHGRPFHEFAPYKQAWLAMFQQRFGRVDKALFQDQAESFERLDIPVQAVFTEDQCLLTATERDDPLVRLMQLGGEAAAWQQWQKFSLQLDFYPLLKAFPAKKATSLLSAYLSAGCLSPRVLAQMAAHAGAVDWLENLIRRDFYLQRAFHGQVGGVQSAVESIPVNKVFLQRWTQGCSGFPLIDAAMRCLNKSGWLAPALRQTVAQFWCHTLQQPWQHGAAWFAQQQTDHDDAINEGNWQDIAAAPPPSRRIMHLVLESQRLDPDGTFIRRYLPELAHLPKNAIHAPWLAGADIDCHGYPLPMVEVI